MVFNCNIILYFICCNIRDYKINTRSSKLLHKLITVKPNKKFTFQSGVRYNYIEINADLTDNNKFYNFPFNDADLKTAAFTATTGISWSPNEILQWKLNGTY